jgi:GWxTD domain-containing protein
MNKNKITPFLFISLISILSACNNSYIDKIDRGSGYEYQAGHPEFRLSSFSYYDTKDTANLRLTIEIVYGSLIYKKPDDFFEASGNLSIEIYKESDKSTYLHSLDYPIKVKQRESRITQSQETLFITRDFNVSGGNYLINVTLLDSLTNNKTTRSEEITIPALNSEKSNVTDIQILTKEDEKDSFNPVTTYDISESVDSLKFVFQVLKQNTNAPLTLDMKLYKFEADSSFARRMNSNDYSTGSIFYKGIDYGSKELINSRRRVLTDPGNVLVELVFLSLPRGNYRLEVISNDTEEIYKGIDFSVKSKNYPTLYTPKELAMPLSYLMKKEDYENLLSINDSDSLKKAVDRFWLKNIQNKSIARSTISLYYERVEEANKLFANFKEGWKTDMGMMYILFGAPWSISQNVNRMTWSYSFNLEDRERNFNFYAPKMNNKYFPFEHYVLDRNSIYYSLYYQQIQLWLSGKILTSNI